MSLEVGKFFIKALKANTALNTAIGGRLFPVARSSEDEALDRIPYIIMEPSGVTNQEDSKDDAESQYDSATINLLVVSDTYANLVSLTEQVRNIIRSAAETHLSDNTWNFELVDYNFSADQVQYDPVKPCYYQTLSYVCSTINYRL